MPQTIWDLKKGQQFKTHDGASCKVITPSEDGKGLVAKYLDGDLVGQEDFIFESEIELIAVK
jgi:hypothetical protein